jgi:hypothetical protein
MSFEGGIFIIGVLLIGWLKVRVMQRIAATERQRLTRLAEGGEEKVNG